MSRVAPLLNKATAAIAVAAARPVGNVGVDITGWNIGAFSPSYCALQVGGDQAITLASPTGGTGGPELWGMVNGRWGFLTFLNKGNSIGIVGALLDYLEEVEHVGICTRLYVAATPNGGNPTVIFIPLETWGAQ